MTDSVDNPSSPPAPSLVPSAANLKEIPPEPRATPTSDAPDDVVPSSAKPPEQLGFQMRFEAGRALLALDNVKEAVALAKGIDVRRALFEVPDVAFPLDVSGGALRFQSKRLTLRAVELAISWEALFVVDSLRKNGLTLLRERSRAGGLELLVEVQGPSGGVPVRARCVFAPVGEGGVALVLHEVIGFGALPRPRLQLAPALLDALAFPGGLPARAMVRRAEPFRAVFSRLLPAYGWKVPALGDVRVHEAVLGKGEVVLRAWSGKAPDGWKAPKEQKRGPLEEAIALAVFADGLVDAVSDDDKKKLIDRLIDQGGLARAAIPFAAEILRADPRRRADGDDLVKKALEGDDEHLGLLAAHADAAEIDAVERAQRLLRLGAVADADDEPWVAARASLAAAVLAEAAGDNALAVKAAEAAVDADPSVAEAGILLSRLLVKAGDKARALVVGRAALDRAGSGSIVEPEAALLAADHFAVELAAVAKDVEGRDAARLLLRRALRTREMPEALVPLVELEIDSGNFERAAEGITRLLVISQSGEAAKGLPKDVALLAARLAEQKGDKESARGHLVRARQLSQEAGGDDPRVALRLARLYDEAGDAEQALSTLAAVVGDDADLGADGDVASAAVEAVRADVRAAMFFAARLYVARARDQKKPADAERARALIARLPADSAHARVDAEARALLDDPAPLARLLLQDAEVAQEARAATALRTEAARLFLRGATSAADADAAHALVDDAAAAIAAAFVKDAGSIGDLVLEVAGGADSVDVVTRVGRALNARGADLEQVWALARRLSSTGKPKEARALLAERSDKESRELRATFAKDAADVDAEILERRALLDLVDGSARQTQRFRLAVLFERAGRFEDAADAWLAVARDNDGADVDNVDVPAWLRVAIATKDGGRLAPVLVRDDVDLSGVDSGLLRSTIDHVDDPVAQRRLLATLASRNDDVKDVERWLDAARALPKSEAALAFVDAARRSSRVDWLLDGVQQLVDIGEAPRALAALNDVIAAASADGRLAVLAGDRRVVDRAFDLAVSLDDAASVEARANDLFARADLAPGNDDDARRDLHRRRVDAHSARAPLAQQALAQWLDERPADRDALDRLVARAIDGDGSVDLGVVVDRLDRARARGLDDDARALVVAVADAARERGSDAEVRARELLLGFSLDPALRERVQRRLVDLCVRGGRPGRAIDLLGDLVQQAKDAGLAGTEKGDATIAGLWLRIADLEEEERKDQRAAASALEQLLQHAPDDATASRRLLALLLEQNDDDALARECLRRASRLAPSAERTELLLRAGEVARRRGRLDEARRIFLRALGASAPSSAASSSSSASSPPTEKAPFSKDALDRLLDLAKETGSRRLAIRARLKAARVLEAENPREATRQAAEAGGLLAGVLRRVRLAVTAFAFAERVGVERGVDDDGAHSRMLVELFRALNDGKNARLRLDRLVERAEGRDRARLLEARADVSATLLDDVDAAIADRRAALAVDPAFSAAARALVRLLQKQGDLRSAVDVERAHADAASTGEARGLTYARLVQVAADEIKDPALVDELAVVALELRSDADVRRRLVTAREALGNTSRTIEALRGLLGEQLSADERLARALRCAALEEESGNNAAAVMTLQSAVDDEAVKALPADDAARDEATARLARLLAATGQLKEAAGLVLAALLARPEGSPGLGARNVALERAGVWLDDAHADGDGNDASQLALDTLVAAADAGGLSDDGEVRRARLAEELDRADVAVLALESLISRNIEVSENAPRLAAAAERAGDARKALAAWQLRLGHVSDDVAALTAVERLAGLTGDAVALRRSSEELVKRAVGTASERAARAIVVANDAKDREGDATGALLWLEEARALESTPELRKQAFALAKDIDDEVALAVLDDMDVSGDVLTPSERHRRAALRLKKEDGNVPTALKDIVAVLEQGSDDVKDLLAIVATRAPGTLLQTALAHPMHRSLRAALVDLDDARIADDDVYALAAFVSREGADVDEAAVRAAARRDTAAGRASLAADRLLDLRDRLVDRGSDSSENDETRALVDDAAALYASAGGNAVLEKLEKLRPAFRRKPALRDAALTALRDIEAWAAVASVLDDAIVVVDDAVARRALRLQLVSVLREGVATREAEERAAEHLQQLVDDDVNDREAWGELFECLEQLKDDERLQQALGRRAEHAEGIERRELVRRRLEILLALGRAAEGLASLQAVRKENDDDALKELEQRVHKKADADGGHPEGGAAWAAFLDAELVQHAADPAVVEGDARALLGLPVALVPAGARVRAHVALIGDGQRAPSILFSSQPVEMRIAEAVAVVVAADKDHGTALVAALAEDAGRIGSAAALDLADALFAAGADVGAFAAPTAARRWRTRGVRAVDVDVQRLSGRARSSLALRRAARLGDRAALEAAANDLGVNVDVGVSGVAAGFAARAHALVVEQARAADGTVALLRHGDARGLARAQSSTTIARRARAMPLTPKRLLARLALAPVLGDEQLVQDELARAVVVADRTGDTAVTARALDALFAVRAPLPAELVRRADAALALREPEAAAWASRAADAAVDVNDVIRLRKKAIEGFLAASDMPALGRDLLALAEAAPAGKDGDDLRNGALSTAEAARLTSVADAIMAKAAEQFVDVSERAAALRRRAELRVAAKDPVGAYNVLKDGAVRVAALADGTDAARALRDDAYDVAAGNALVDAMLEVVDDDLAKAGVLAVLGDRAAARALAAALVDDANEAAGDDAGRRAAALWLIADCALVDDDTVAEERALQRLADLGLAQDAVLVRLIDASRRRGDVDDAVARALALVRSAPSKQRLRLVVDCLTDARVSPARRATGTNELLELVSTTAVSKDDAAFVVEAAVDVAAATPDLALRKKARHALGRLHDSDEVWARVVAADLADAAASGDASDVALTLQGFLNRRGLVAALTSTPAITAPLAAALQVLVRGGDALAVADALAGADHAWQLKEVHAAALAVTGKSRDAADVLATLVARPQEGMPLRSLRLRASELYVESDTAGAAARLLVGLDKDDVDDAVLVHARDVVDKSARVGAMGDAARLAAHLARLSGDDKFVLRALAAADAAGGDTALTIGAWRLRLGDTRALPLLAHHALEGSAAQGFFAAWHALQIGVRSFAPNAPADFHALTRLKNLELGAPPAHTASSTSLARARRNGPAARKAAWRALAAEVASSDDIAAARLLSRAGVPMSDAPLEVRLAADPDLADLGVRAAAIAAGLASVKAERRAAVVAAFDLCSQKGFTSAAQRRHVDGVIGRAADALAAAIDAAALGEAVDVASLLKSLKRRPTPAQRSTTAALLQSLGQHALAALLHPAIVGSAVVDDVARLKAFRAAQMAEGAGDDLVGLGQLRLSQLVGPRVDVEERISSIAARLGKKELLAESLLRQASLTSDVAERGALLARRAAALLEKNPRAARRAAEAAFATTKSEDHARLLVTCAERIDDPKQTEEALALWQSVAVADDDRHDAALRRARLLARRMLRPEDAVAVLDDALAAAPSAALFVEKAAILEELVNDPKAAAMALLNAVDVGGPAAEANPLRLKAAALLERDRTPSSVELAVTALCEAFENGEAGALNAAESVARSADPGPGLARVLDLRLREIEDPAARRVIVLERARLLADLDDKAGATALLEAQAVADDIDLGARLQLAAWYLADRRILDAALAFESAARIPGLPPMGFGPPAREAASLLAALGDLERAGPLADMACAAGVTDLEVLSVAEAWHRAHENWTAVDELLGKELFHVANGAEKDQRREAHLWMERATVRRDRLADEQGAKKALQSVLDLVPDHPRALQMMREEAQRADTWGALRMALWRASEVTADKRAHVAFLREIAAVDADRLSDNKAAQATIDQALNIEPDDVDALVLKASLMVKAGEVDGLTVVMERLERINHQKHGDEGVGVDLPGLLHLVRGDALLLAGDRVGAKSAFRKATEDPETSSKAWDRLIDMADGPSETLPLLDEARRATLDTKRRVQLTRKEMRVRTKQGDEDGAVAAAEALLGLEPGDVDGLKLVREHLTKKRKLKDLAPYLLGWARSVDAASNGVERARRLAETGAFTLDELGQEGPARALFEEALSVQADQPVALVRLADIAWASRDDERALDLLDRIPVDQWTALPDDTGSPRLAAELLFRRARCAYAMGNADVRERLRMVLRSDAKHKGALEMLAKVALEAHDDDAAEMALESLSRAIGPREDPVRLATVLVDLAQLRSRQKKVDEACAAAERAFELNPSNLLVLETLAAAREEAGKFVDAAEAFRRIAAVKSGGDRRRALERRAHSLATGGRTKDAVTAWLELFAESNDGRHQKEAQELARRSGDPELLKKAGMAEGGTASAPAPVSIVERAPEHTRTESMAMAPAGGGSAGAIVIQLRANLDENDPQQALNLALAARAAGQTLDEQSTGLAILAAEKVGNFGAAVDLAEARLQTATEPQEVRRVALEAGRVARDRLHDDDRAAALLYQAHQADAEDVEVRLELTELYARIPRLASHAVTGILQLLRRTPSDARVFALAATLADGQGQAERAAAMRTIEALLKGKGSPQDAVPARVGESGAVAALDRDAIASRLAPTGWNGPLQQLISLLGIHLEVALGGASAPQGAKPLAQASPKSLALAERVDRLLPGRVAQLLIADVDKSTVVAASVPQIVLPRELLTNETALMATVARGLAVVRLGAVVTELIKPGQELELVDLLRAALLGQGPKDARSELLTSRLREDEKQSARILAQQALQNGASDVAGTLQILTRACDRFALVATGSPVAALSASALPSLLKEPPQRAMMLLQGSVRALELCAFAARDNAWLLRRQQGLGG